MHKIFWKQNGKPIFIGVLIFVGFVIFAIWAFENTKKIDKDYSRLAQKGVTIEGRITKFKPFPGSRIFNEAGKSIEQKPGVHVSIEYSLNGVVNPKIHEEWPLRFKEAYVVGEKVRLLYLESNRFVRVSSINNRRIVGYLP